MSRIGTVRELASSGQYTPQELKDLMVKREKQQRDAQRGGALAALVMTAASNTNPKRVVAQGDLEGLHRQIELDFLKQAIGGQDPDQYLDTDVMPVGMERLRKMARKYADIHVEAAAVDARIAKLRGEALDGVATEVGALRVEVAKQLAPANAMIMATEMQLAKRVYEAVK